MFGFNLGPKLRGGTIALFFALALNLHAGGSGLNTVVVINQNSSNSIELGNYFCERRQLPPENVLRVNWSGGNISWSSTEFQANLLTPLLSMLTSRQLTNQIDYVVLSMDLPFQTLNGSVVNSTTAALFYGLKVDSGPEWAGITNSYAGSEQVFRQAKPASAPGVSFLTTMLTAGSLAQAKQLVDQGANSDGTFPAQTALLAKSSDPVRNLRHRFFDNAIFNVQLLPERNYSLSRVNADIPPTAPALLGLQTGLANFSIAPNSFVPGAMADSLTSYGGIIFGPNGQTTLLAFIHAGAAGSYGTVTEPQAVADKFPDPQNYFYQSRGFTLAECYYQSLKVPYQGLLVGEPLAAPWQKLASGTWVGVSSNALLSGIVPLNVNFTAADAGHPLQKIDLFVDGKFNRTITNLPPQPGNVLELNLNSHPMNYVVPANATVASVVSALADLVNLPANSNATRVAVFAHGDRLELRSTSFARLLPPQNLHVIASTPPGTTNFPASSNTPPLVRSDIGSAGLLSTFVTPGRELFLDTSARGLRAFVISGTMQIGTWLQATITKTNGTQISLAVTNQSVSGTPYTLVGQLATLINATSALQGADGAEADDYGSWFSGGGQFNLRARSPGLAAARLKAQLTTGSLVINPSGEAGLTDNLSDLQSRNHIYVTAGATNLGATFALNTSALTDGFHELSAVAYEGSHVQTQTRITLPVRVQNSGLSAAFSLLDLADPSPVGGVYHIQVVANTNNVSAIKLFSTGGLLNTVSNQANATFTVSGPSLGVGQHSFYAVIETTSGRQYRTETRRVRLISGP